MQQWCRPWESCHCSWWRWTGGQNDGHWAGIAGRKGENTPLTGMKTTQLSSQAAEGRMLEGRMLSQQCQRRRGLTSCSQHDGHLVNLAPPTSCGTLPLWFQICLRIHKIGVKTTQPESKGMQKHLHTSSPTRPLLLFMHSASGWHLGFYIWQ